MSSEDFFYKHLPWNFITMYHDGVVIQKDGILQRTFAYRAPDIDSAGSFEINQLSIRVNDFAKRLGTGWAFHIEAQRFQLQEYPKGNFDILAPYLIDRDRSNTFNSTGRHFDSSYYLTFTYKPPADNVKKLQSMFVNSGNSGEKNNSFTIKQNVEYFVNESDSVASLLSGNLLLVPLNNEETIQYLHSTISFNRNWINFPHTQILLDRILPDTPLENSMPMKLGDYYIPIIGVCDFPESTYPAILDSLNRALIEYRWVTRYICLDKEEGKKITEKKEKSHRGNQSSFLQLLASSKNETPKVTNHGASVKTSDAIEANIEIDTDVAALGYLTTCVMVWNKSLKKAKEYADLVRTIINSKGFNCKEENYNAFESFKSMMPGQIYANYRALPVMTNTMSHIVPLSSIWSGIRSSEHAYNVTGVDTSHLICSTAEGTPFYLCLNVGDVGHSSIFGPTGAGKSTLTNLLSIQFLKYPGSQIITFDKGRSCRQPCLACGGYFYEPASENAAGINFQPLRDLDTDTDILYACDFIESCITANNENVTSAMSTAIKETLDQMKDIDKSRRTITTFLQYCQYQDKDGRRVLNELLSAYAIGGKYGRIFDDNSSEISMNSRWIAFEMEALMNRGDNCVVPALVYLFNTVEKQFTGRLTLLMLDEAWLFLKNEIFADKIAEWLKVLRKKNVYVVFATQDVADVYNSALRTTIMQQCYTKIYLADPSALTPGMKKVYEAFGLTETEISLIASAQMKRDYFYTSTIGRRLFQLSLDKLTLSLIGSPDHTLLDDIASKYEPGSFLCKEILEAKDVYYQKYLYNDAPNDPTPILRKQPFVKKIVEDDTFTDSTENTYYNNTIIQNETTSTTSPSEFTKNAELFEAVLTLPDKKQKNGQGRAAEEISQKFGISTSYVYIAKKVINSGSDELINALKSGEISFKTAYKRLKQEQKQINETIVSDEIFQNTLAEVV